MQNVQARGFIPALHGLRGLMAFWVVLFHTNMRLPFVRDGYFGVDVFFLLSGYVLMHRHAAEFRRVTPAGVWAFIRKRFWRIYPMCFVSVILGVLAYYVWHQRWPQPVQVMQSLAILDIWVAPGLGTTRAAWSLGVECLGYLAFPLLACGLLRLPTAALLAAGVLLLCGATAYMAAIGDGWNHIRGVAAVTRMGAGFGIGCAMFLLPSATRYGDLMATLACIGLVVAFHFERSLAVMPFLVLLVYGIASSGGFVARAISAPPLLFLGRISFSLYLTHEIVFRLTMDGNRTFNAYTVAMICAALALAAVLCLAIEEPVNRWGRHTKKASEVAPAGLVVAVVPGVTR